MTELIWEGKYKDKKKVAPIRVALPFQTIETVNESAQERQRMLDLFSAGRDADWRNRLIWGDKKYVLPSLLPEFAGKVNLIYIDPPFDTGADFSFTATVPDDPMTDEDETASFVKEPSIIEQKAYRDTWGRGLDSYLQWFYETAVLFQELLSETGSLYVHLDWHVGHYAKCVLDEVFGPDKFVNQVIWKRQSAKHGAFGGLGQYGRIHEILLFYGKGDSWTWNQQFASYEKEYIEGFYKYSEDGTGRRFQLGDLTAAGSRRGDSGSPIKVKGESISPPAGRHWALGLKSGESVQDAMDRMVKEGRIWYERGKMPRYRRYLDEMSGVMLQDVWTDIGPVPAQGTERLNYATQKPEALLERIIRTSSNEGDLVLDCFVGSGTTAAVAEKLGRRWIACDLGRFAIHTTRKRLLSIREVRPFVVQNLGKYERQAWQAAEFTSDESQVERELRYRRFILDLYKADPVTGYTWLHGVKGGRMVHVGSVEAPVTLSDVKAIAAEVWRSAGRGKHATGKAAADILGWDFALEVNEVAKQVAAESKVDVAFKIIPREVLEKKAVEQGDIRFFELASLAVDIRKEGSKVTVVLSDFVIPPQDVPEDVQKAVKHWSQWVDYWAIDWDYKNDTFHNEWQSYRTRKEATITLEASHTYEQPGEYQVVVKVIDILGNDTTKLVTVKVSIAKGHKEAVKTSSRR